MLEQNLKELGLTDKEAAIYLCILQYQRISPTRVSELTNINRPTVYSVAEELIKKSLIAEDNSASTKYYYSLGEESLQSLVTADQRKIELKKRRISELLPELKQLPKEGRYSIPKIRFIDEPQLRDFLISQSPIWAKAALSSDKTWWGFQDDSLLEYYQDWADYFWNSFSKEIQLNLLTNKKLVEERVMPKKKYASQRHIKFWSDSTEFTTTQVVIGDYILMIMTREHPHYLIEIHDRVMANNLREMFKAIWKMV